MLGAFFERGGLSPAALARLTNGVEVLFHHLYAHRLDAVLAAARRDPRHQRALFLVAVALEPSVQAYVRAECGPEAASKVAAFVHALGLELDHLVGDTGSVDAFLDAARAAWWVS